MKILIADDSAMIRERMSKLITGLSAGHSIQYADNAAEAIKMIHDATPDIVLLDIQMPGGSGMEVIHSAVKEIKPPIIIVLTNHAYPEYRKEYLEAGADYFFDKSSEFKKVRNVLSDLFKPAQEDLLR